MSAPARSREETPYDRPLGVPLFGTRSRFPARSWTYRSHGTPDWLLMLTLSGRLRTVFPDGSARTHQAGAVLLYAPGAVQNLGVDGDHWEVSWAHFVPRPEWMEFLNWPLLATGIHHLDVGANQEAFQGLAIAMSRLHDTLGRTGELPHAIPLAMNALEETILLLDGFGQSVESAAGDPRIRCALSILAREWRNPPSTADLARRCGLSVSRFCDLFRSLTGLTLKSYVEHRRLEQAKLMLSVTAQPVQSIAYDLGFNDPYYFSRRFSRAFGQSPRVFRQAR